MQQLARDAAGNVWDTSTNPPTLVQQAGAQPSQQHGQVFTLPQDPAEAARQAATDSRANAADRRAQEKAEREAREWAATHNPDGSPKPTANNNGSAELTAATRANAINAFTATRQLDQLIRDIEAQYEAGPGSTKGIAGVMDWLPTPSNRGFDAAGNAVRGAAITALGFTSGQTNSPKEVEMNIGPYIPAAGDYDQVIEGKIARLKELRDRARVQAVTVLGGVPSADGRITPVTQIPQQERDRLFPPGTMQPTDMGTPGGGLTVPPVGGNGAPPAFRTGSDAPAADRIDRSSTLMMGPGGGPGAIDIPTGQMITQDDPALAGVNATLAGMWQKGEPYERIVSYMRSVGIDPANSNAAELEAFRRKNPTYKGAYNVNVDDINVPMSGAQQMMNKVGSGPIGAASMSAANTIVPLDRLTSNPEVTRAIMSGVAQQNPGASLAGTIGGGVLGAGAMEVGLGRLATRVPGALSRVLASPMTADAAFGAAQGAMSADPGQGGAGAATGATAGLFGGMFGRGVARKTGDALTGVRNEAVRTLAGEGIPMTLGQALGQSGRVGSIIKGVEDRISGFPVVGDMVNARRREGLEGLRTASLNESLRPINATVESATGDEAAARAQQLVSGAYDDALSGVNLQVDPAYKRDMGSALMAARNLPGPLSDTFTSTMQNRVAPMFDGTSLTGRNFQGAIQGLRKDAGALIKRDEVQADIFRDRTNDVEEALFGLAERQAPGTREALTAANAANRRLSIVEDAMARGENNGGLFTAAQLGTSIKSNAKRFNGGKALARGEMPLQGLQRAAQEVLPSQVPDSGTAGRLALPLLATAGGAGAGYAAGDAQTGALAGAGLAAGYSRPVQQALVAAMLNRPEAVARLGQELLRRRQIGGMFGAGVAVPLLTGP